MNTDVEEHDVKDDSVSSLVFEAAASSANPGTDPREG